MRNIQALTKKIQELEQTTAKAQGKVDLLMEELKSLGCEDLEDAEEQLVEAEAAATKAENDFETKLTKFEEKWGEIL